MTSSSLFLLPAAANNYRHATSLLFNASKTSTLSSYATSFPTSLVDGSVYRRRVFSPLLLRPSDSMTFVEAYPSGAVAVLSEEEQEEKAASAAEKIGVRVRVKAPLKVYHVPRIPEIDLTGKEGVLKQYVGVWKGRHISANLPFKVGFVVDVEGRGPVKFFAHLKEDEFELLD